MGWGTSFEVTSYHEAGEIPLDKWNSVKPELLGVVVDNVVTEIKEYTNKVPTHDPYTNPKSHIYYSCECGQILDPGTHRFAELNNAASKAGWKIRWSDRGYVPHCVECARGIE